MPYFIAFDTHCEFTEMAVLNSRGKLVRRQRCPTTIPTLVEAIESVKRPRQVTFEEGPLAGWLSRNLRDHADQVLVCDPRRNAYVAKEGDKDDPIDAERLAQLLRGGFLKEVHQVDSLDRSLLKQHVAFYHDRVRERVRQGHQLTALLRRYGVFASISKVNDPDERRLLWKQLPRRKVLHEDLDCVLKVYQLLLEQEERLRARLTQLARKEPAIRRFREVPGFGWIRAATFYVYIDAPARFRSKSALWRYCGIGLERRHSGSGPQRVRLCIGGSRPLKNILMGAAKSAIAQSNGPFADRYEEWTQQKGVNPATARRNIARSLAATLWSLWKNDANYDPDKSRRPEKSSLETR
ncbi:transposase [Blastopirellula marina]|uniref:Uncharacterized protein n=1 Tax=Blastopirellula marina TaxID=124 RepID=A0A2S8GKH2_9BACT|nr:transposase [Blastopirellula marina]PQO44943.1 hypothetical protein C5Y93_15485 [Blastopirellula marina]